MTHGQEGQVKVKVLVALLCPPTLCNPMDWSLPSYSVQGIIPSPGDLPDPGIEPGSPALQTDSLPSEPPMKLEAARTF